MNKFFRLRQYVCAPIKLTRAFSYQSQGPHMVQAMSKHLFTHACIKLLLPSDKQDSYTIEGKLVMKGLKIPTSSEC